MAFRPESTLNPKTLRREAIQLAIVAGASLGLYFMTVAKRGASGPENTTAQPPPAE